MAKGVRYTEEFGWAVASTMRTGELPLQALEQF